MRHRREDVAAGILFGMFELLRRGQLKEKYAALWLVVGIVVAVLGIAPGLINVMCCALTPAFAGCPRRR